MAAETEAADSIEFLFHDCRLWLLYSIHAWSRTQYTAYTALYYQKMGLMGKNDG